MLLSQPCFIIWANAYLKYDYDNIQICIGSVHFKSSDKESSSSLHLLTKDDIKKLKPREM